MTIKRKRAKKVRKLIKVVSYGPANIPAGRYISLSQYCRENGLSYQNMRSKLLEGKTRKRYYRVGRAWILRA